MITNENSLLKVKNLHASVDNLKILNGLSLTVNPGEVHAIMGPNGSGKSTLSKVLVGHPSYTVLEGDIYLNDENITFLSPEERSHKGLFLAFQYPVEIPGINNEEFLKLIYNTKKKLKKENPLSPLEFFALIKTKLEMLGMNIEFLYRNINEGFSGGEKKRNELLQFALLDSQVGILDEIDSGLDIDALRIVAEAIKKLMTEKRSVILITHYKRIFDYIQPDFVHVMQAGQIIKTGDSTLPEVLEKKGYQWLSKKE